MLFDVRGQMSHRNRKKLKMNLQNYVNFPKSKFFPREIGKFLIIRF